MQHTLLNPLHTQAPVEEPLFRVLSRAPESGAWVTAWGATPVEALANAREAEAEADRVHRLLALVNPDERAKI